MSIVLTKAVKEKIKTYHRYHGDKVLKIVKIIQDSNGYDAVLVRILDSHGNKYSCIDLMDLQGDFSEFISVETECELEMIKEFEES